MIALDLSRLLSRAGRSTPTGIDRVELAYAEHLIATRPDLCFAALSPLGNLGLLPRPAAERFVAGISAEWHGNPVIPPPALKRLSRRLRWGALRREAALYRALRSGPDTPIYLLVSHHHLEREAVFVRLKQRSGARFVGLIHDLIPVEFPEYAKPGQAAHHLRRIESAVRTADAFIVNSWATEASLRPQLDRLDRAPEVVVAPFGAELPKPPPDGPAPIEHPYFVYVSTIEARKNHLMLLNVWRSLAAECGGEAPRLVLIGQRGWEVESVIDMLERSPSLRGLVIERNTLSDSDMVALLAHARALLMPSFAEGFGFPIIEGMALGVPVLSSNIPALMETGGEIPEYLDPLDGLGWREAILDYAAPDSARRQAQLERLARWRPPRWQEHFARVDPLLSGPARG